MATLKALQWIPPRPKDVTFGYVRQMQAELAIPPIISYLILCYYCYVEYFEKAGDDLEISNNKCSITRITTPISNKAANLNTAYGKRWIKGDLNKIAKWSFIIENYGTCKSLLDVASIYIGIVSIDNRCNADFGKGGGALKYFHFTSQYSAWGDLHLIPMKKFDILFDTINWKLIIQMNNMIVDEKAITSPNHHHGTKYKLALSMTRKDASLTLVDFDVM